MRLALPRGRHVRGEAVVLLRPNLGGGLRLGNPDRQSPHGAADVPHEGLGLVIVVSPARIVVSPARPRVQARTGSLAGSVPARSKARFGLPNSLVKRPGPSSPMRGRRLTRPGTRSHKEPVSTRQAGMAFILTPARRGCCSKYDAMIIFLFPELG